MDRYLARGKRVDNGEWVSGGSIIQFMDDGIRSSYIPKFGEKCRTDEDEAGNLLSFESGLFYKIDTATLGRYTGLRDKDYRLIYEGDITELALPDGSVRLFEVNIKTVIREVVSHPDFDDPTAKVAIAGVVFTWNGYDLFPCVDDNGMIDTEKMSVVGNIHDNPDLLGEEGTP